MDNNSYLTETNITEKSAETADTNNVFTVGYDQIPNIPTADKGVVYNINNNYSNIANLLVLIVIFVLAKFIFTRFLLVAKRGQGTSENFAYSISVFSLFLSLSIILTSVIYGNVPVDFYESLAKLVSYSILGIIFLIFSGLIFDKVGFRKIGLNVEIAKGNVAAAITDAGNFIASALIIAASLKWYEFKSWDGIIAILVMYIASQIILIISVLIRKSLFNYFNRQDNFEQQLLNGNKAMATSFAGRRIGTALAITAATNLLPFHEGYGFINILIEWIYASVVIIIFFNIISWVASKIILWENVNSKIVNKNINIALIDAAIYIGFGLILASTLM